jgi:hypothetical protein
MLRMRIGVAARSTVEASPIPLLFKEGRLRLNKKIPFLSSADGVVSNFKQNKEQYASIQGGYATFYRLLIDASPYRARASRPQLLTV